MLQRVKIQYYGACMELGDFADLLIKQYGDRSQYPKDEEQLKALILLCDKTAQALRVENAALKKSVSDSRINQKFKKKVKK